MPLSFITVGLTNALPYPIIDDAEGFVECLKNTRLVVVSCHFLLKTIYSFFSMKIV